jgi:hypothetical protein
LKANVEAYFIPVEKISKKSGIIKYFSSDLMGSKNFFLQVPTDHGLFRRIENLKTQTSLVEGFFLKKKSLTKCCP